MQNALDSAGVSLEELQDQARRSRFSPARLVRRVVYRRPPLSRLKDLARLFAADINELLNGTVTDGIRLSTAVHRPDLVIIGRSISKGQLAGGLIPLTLGRRAPGAYLRVNLTLEMDDPGTYLAGAKSSVAVYDDEGGRHMLCHYDYEREPAHVYPDPHFQVEGNSEALRLIAERRPLAASSLREVHFPVGGRRFRPTLEDVIEMLVAEGIAEPRDGWKDVIAVHREAWCETQLKAAVRRWPEWAAECLSLDPPIGFGGRVGVGGCGGETSGSESRPCQGALSW